MTGQSIAHYQITDKLGEGGEHRSDTGVAV